MTMKRHEARPGGERSLLDQYWTPSLLVAMVVPHIPLEPDHTVCEPHAGSGRWLRRIREEHPTIRTTAYDLDCMAPGLICAHQARVCDFLETDQRFDWFVGNPPYARWEGQRSAKTGKKIMRPIALEHTLHALSLANVGVCMTFRLGFLAGVQRHAKLWSAHKPAKILYIPKRQSFTGDGKTDMYDNVTVIWRKGDESARGFWLDPV